MTPNDPAARLATEAIERFLTDNPNQRNRYLTEARFHQDAHLLRHFCAATIDELTAADMPSQKIAEIIANVVRHMFLGDHVEAPPPPVPPKPTQPPVTPVLPLTEKPVNP